MQLGVFCLVMTQLCLVKVIFLLKHVSVHSFIMQAWIMLFITFQFTLHILKFKVLNFHVKLFAWKRSEKANVCRVKVAILVVFKPLFKLCDKSVAIRRFGSILLHYRSVSHSSGGDVLLCLGEGKQTLHIYNMPLLDLWGQNFQKPFHKHSKAFKTCEHSLSK